MARSFWFITSCSLLSLVDSELLQEQQGEEENWNYSLIEQQTCKPPTKSSSINPTDLQTSLHGLRRICGGGDQDRVGDLDRDQDLDLDLLNLEYDNLQRRGGEQETQEEGNDKHELLSVRLWWTDVARVKCTPAKLTQHNQALLKGMHIARRISYWSFRLRSFYAWKWWSCRCSDHTLKIQWVVSCCITLRMFLNDSQLLHQVLAQYL